MKEKISNYLYYFIIGIVSFLLLVFMPMIGSSLDMGFQFPKNDGERAIFIVTRTLVSVINVLIFHAFMCQAKLNVKEEEHYIQANEILRKHKEKKYKPRSPKKWNTQQYLSKATTLFFSSLASTFVLTQAILSYDWMALLTYLFTIIMAIVFGILQMKKAEEYWTKEYLDYAIELQKQLEESNIITQEEEQNDKN